MSSEIFGILVKEHENILKIAEILEKECNALESKNKINKEFFMSVISFIKDYADRFHHAKEEKILFKEFETCVNEGRVHCNPVEQMLFEHDKGRAAVKLMVEGVEAGDKNKLITGGRAYTALIREHIFKEDNILYPMADEALSQNVKEKILRGFNSIKGGDKEKKYLKLLKKLES